MALGREREREREREIEGGARGTGGVSSEWEVGWRTPTVECCLDLVVEETTFREEGEQEADHLQGGRRAPSGRTPTPLQLGASGGKECSKATGGCGG